MKKILLSTISTAIIILLSSCSTPPPPDTLFNLSSDDPYRQGQNLVEAIAHGANSAAYRLMEHGAPLNYQDKKDEWTPLIYAIYHWNWRMSKVLIRAGVNVNLADSANRSPLMWAAMRNSGITATILVEHGANINAVDISGRTALQYAIIYGNYTLAAYLADAGRKPPAHRLKKEQFYRLRKKREKAAAEVKNIKLFGIKNERTVIAEMKKEDINRNVKTAKQRDPAKKAIEPQKTEPLKVAPAPKKIEPKKVSKPIKISDILNAEQSAEIKQSSPASPASSASPAKIERVIHKKTPAEAELSRSTKSKKFVPSQTRARTRQSNIKARLRKYEPKTLNQTK